MPELVERREAALRENLSNLVDICEMMDEFDVGHPEAYATLYWAKAVLNPELYVKDHPAVAESLLPLIEAGR